MKKDQGGGGRREMQKRPFISPLVAFLNINKFGTCIQKHDKEKKCLYRFSTSSQS